MDSAASDNAPAASPRPGGRDDFPRGAAAVVLAALIAWVLTAGAVGINYGFHWDEYKMQQTLSRSIKTGLLLPRWYNYPSLFYDVCLLCTAPEWGRPAVSAQDFVLTTAYKVRARAVLMVLTFAGLLWTYGLVRVWRGRRLDAVLAAAFLAGSWEVFYHARWLAPDGLMMQFAVLTLLCCVTAARRRSGGWRLTAAVAAGLTAGTKYPGGLVLLPVLLLPVAFPQEGETFRQRLIAALKLAAVFAVSFLVTTPGAVLEPRHFLWDIQWEEHHYAGGHGGHTVVPGLDHLRRMGTYLGAVALSPYWPCAVALSALAVLGVAVAARRTGWMALYVLAVPILYVAYLAAQRVMIVRNLLVVVPFLAACAGMGAAAVVRLLGRWRGAAVLFLAAITAVVAGNLWWQMVTSLTVGTTRQEAARSLAAYASRHSEMRIFCSPGVRAAFDEAADARPANLVAELTGAESHVAVFHREVCIKDTYWWPTNDPFGLLREVLVLGQNELNFRVYPNWMGAERLLVLPRDVAGKLPGVPVVVTPLGEDPAPRAGAR